MEDNLADYVELLAAGVKPLQIKLGPIRSEGQGVWRVSQQGGGRNLAETRLYVYPDEATETLHLLTLGDKTTQRADIAISHQYAAAIRTAANPAAEPDDNPEAV